MSFLSKLFGGGKPANKGAAAPKAEADHEGFHIATTPMEEGGQYRVSALITREVDGEMKTHHLIRADT